MATPNADFLVPTPAELRDTMRRRIAELEAALTEVCHAATDYDRAIQAAAVEQKSWVEGQSLDDLYARWLGLAEAGLVIAQNA